MDENTPFVAIGNDELGAPLGDTVTCPFCGEEHAVISSDKGSLQFFRHDGALYLCGIGGKAVRIK